MSQERLVTLAIHTLEYAQKVCEILEREGIATELHNVNLDHPVVSPGVRVRIKESDLPLALRIVENREVLETSATPTGDSTRTILVPTDFSDHSFNAALLAFNLARQFGTDLTFIHAYLDPERSANIQLSDVYNYDTTPSANSQVVNDAHASMASFIDRIKDSIKKGDIPAAKFRTVIREGVPEDIIDRYAKSNTPFLIVMGTREAQRKEKELIGSVTAELLDGCRHSIISVPAQCPLSNLQNIKEVTFFCNLDQTDILALDTLKRIFPGINLTINLVYIERHYHHESKKAVDNLLEYCKTHYPDYRFTFRHTPADKLILNESDELIVVPNKRKNIISRLFNPGLAHRILFRNDIPMMVIPV
ncbi:MAG: universal stress protein [Muribaculaceae bacterium]|nr:universal stress protein [Muribaculaceae bacterium]